MSANRFLTVCLQLVLAATMILPLLASGVQAAPYINPAQQAQLNAAPPTGYGPGGPFGTWQKDSKETQTMYLHNNFNGGASNPQDPSTLVSDAWYDTLLPPVVNTAATGAPPNVRAGNREEMRLGGKHFQVPGLIMEVPGTPLFASGGCLTQVQPVLEDTALFALKVNFFAQTTAKAETNTFRVEFFDIGPGCVISSPNPQCATCTNAFASVLAPVAQNQGVFSFPCTPAGGTCTGSPGALLFHGEATICGDLGGNQVVVACSPVYGYTLKKDHAIGIRIHIDSADVCRANNGVVISGLVPCGDEGNAILLYDTQGNGGYPSNFQVVADSTRMNMWSEDRLHAVANTFPPGMVNGIQTNAQDRIVHLNMVQANTWGHNCPNAGTWYANSCVTMPPAPPQPKISDGIEELTTVLRVRDMNPSHTGAGYCQKDGDYCYGMLLSMDETLGLISTDPGQDQLKLMCCNLPLGNLPIVSNDNIPTDRPLGLQRYSYNLAYPPSLKDGEYRVEFQDEFHGWTFPYTFFIGGSGFKFTFNDDEPVLDSTRTIADHLVALGESTKYSTVIENNGVTTDTYAITVPTPGSGWTATVSPNQVTLPPKGHANVDVTIIPPDTAHAGDIKVVSVAAASPGTNAVATLYTRTTYTAEKRHGVSLTTPVQFLEVRPSLAKLAPVTVHNLGTIQDSYVLTTSGAPAGWSVSLSPSFLNVFAASREDVVLTITADASATPGDSFTLTVVACETADDSVCGGVNIPVRVFEVHAINVETLPAPQLQCFTTVTAPPALLVQSLIPCSRITMRDAEWDYRTTSTTDLCTVGLAITDYCDVIANRDTKFDDGALFRVKVSNDGDTLDTVDLTSAWDAPAFHPDVTDASSCDGASRDGVPDGWRFRVLGGAAGTNPFSNDASAGVKTADPGMIFPTPSGPTPTSNLVFDNADATTYGWGTMANPQHGTGQRSNPGFSGDYHVGALTLAPHTAQFVYFELMWKEPNAGAGCTGQPTWPDVQSTNYRSTMPSTDAYFRVSYRSNTEESIRGNMLLHAHLADGNDPGANVVDDPGNTRTATVNSNGDDVTMSRHSVLLERGIAQPNEMLVPLPLPAHADFNFVATNTGNEYDNLKIDVDDGLNGWKHQIVTMPFSQAGTGVIPSGAGALLPTDASSPPCPNGNNGKPICVARLNRGFTNAAGEVGCPFTDTPSNQHILCKGMGVYDALNFQVRCTPPDYARIGDYDDMRVTVTSDRGDVVSGLNIFSRQTVRCTVQGDFNYEVENPNHDLLAYRTQTIAFPYSLHNTGLANDRYSVRVDAHVDPSGNTIDPAKDTWNPQTSSGSVAAVPAGFWYHGFLSVTVPADAMITDDTDADAVTPDTHFRLILQSLDSPGHESKVLDFTAIVGNDPAFTLSAQPITIAGGSSDAIVLKALDCAPGETIADCNTGGLQNVEFSGYYLDPARNLPPLPHGTPANFRFTCLKGDTDGDLFSDHDEIWDTEALPPISTGHGLAYSAWKDDTVKPAVNPTPNLVTSPHFDPFRGCWDRTVDSKIPDMALPPNCYPTSKALPYPPCGAWEYHVTPTFSSARDAIQQLEIYAPPNQLGISRVAHRIQADAIKGTDHFLTYTDAIINMKTVYGIELNVTDDPKDTCGHGCKVVPPGANPLEQGQTGILFNVSVINTGLSPQSVLLTNSALPPDWKIFYDASAVLVQPPGYQLPGINPGSSGQPSTTPGTPAAACAAATPCFNVDPQDVSRMQVGLLAPANAAPGTRATVLIFGTVQEDTTKVAQLRLTAEVGAYGISLTMTPETYYMQPGESARFLVSVTNTGTVKDNIDLTAALDAAFSDAFPNCGGANTGGKFRACFASQAECSYDSTIQTLTVANPPDPNTCYIDALDRNETRQVVVEVNAPPQVQSTGKGPGYLVSVNARSKLAPNAPVTAHMDKTVKVLDYVAADVDGDGGQGSVSGNGLEYAIDACTKSQEEGCAPDPTDGYELFRESTSAGGIVSREAPLTQFLDEESRAAIAAAGHMNGESYFLDANNDQHADHFIDTNGDGVPDVLWVPDYGGDIRQMVVDHLNFTRDVTGDQLPELFIDLDGDARWDMVFDMAKGQFFPLIQAFIDDGNVMDYVVDTNKNGQFDPGETVLIGGPGGSVVGTIFNVDMDGDGVLDKAFDLKGDNNGQPDGIPEYFIDGNCNPTQGKGACGSIAITPKDVTGDGKPDWTYDHTGKNGRPDAYYDPNCTPTKDTPCSGMIDTQAQFWRDLQKYWIVGALFAVALVLFVALLVVTRRR